MIHKKSIKLIGIFLILTYKSLVWLARFFYGFKYKLQYLMEAWWAEKLRT